MKLGMQALGLALASVLGLWVFLIIQAQYFFTKRANFRFQLKGFRTKDSWSIVRIGAPGALTCGYLTIRGFWVNALITSFVGAVGLSAFTACNTFLNLFWAVPNGMAAVSRMLFSVAQGEEDRQTIQDIMRNALYRYVPIMIGLACFIFMMAVPFTGLYYHDESNPVFMMTVWGFRLLPFCLPLSVICMHFSCYGQISNKQVLVHTLAVLDGVLDCRSLYSCPDSFDRHKKCLPGKYP
jgi:Na+-driven multidrug efflux pump